MKRPEVENDGAFQLTSSDGKMIVPLRQVCFNVLVSQGFADIVIHQRYENYFETPLEVIFTMPISSTFACNKIAVDYTLPDGKVESIETIVTERQRAQEVYEDAVASGEAAVIATLPPANTQLTRQMMRIALGNMPANSKANLRAFCSQKLETEDCSYCLRIPMAFVPAYLGPVSN